MPTRLEMRTIVIAGLIGQLAFEAYAWLISPLIFGPALAPANLVMALSKIYLGVTLSYWVAFVIHFFIGAVGFAALVWLVHKISKLGLVLSGAVTGLVLWFIAQGMLAPAVGRPFMMEYGPYTQSSAVAHIGMALLMGYVMLKMSSSDMAPRPAE